MVPEKKSNPKRAAASSNKKNASLKVKSNTSKAKKKSISATFYRIVFLSGILFAILIVVLMLSWDKDQQTALIPDQNTSRQTTARTPAEVEQKLSEILKNFDIDKNSLKRIGTVLYRKRERLTHQVYSTDSEGKFVDLFDQLETLLKTSGVVVYGRMLRQDVNTRKFTVFIGTDASRTHRIDIEGPVINPNAVLASPHPENTVMEPVDQSSKKTPQIALVFDDFGTDLNIAQKFLDQIDVPITLAVIPGLSFSEDTIILTRDHDQTVFLHLPMEPESASAMGSQKSDFLTTQMSDTQLKESLKAILDDIPRVDGVNNHMGSKLTADPHRMRCILTILKDYNLPFLDSRTTHKTVAADIAAEIGLAHASRDVFIDQGNNGGDVDGNLDLLVTKAIDNGTAIGIGHAQIETLDALCRKLPEIKAQGIQIVSVLELMKH
ncbi:divergent polysaccharide deacetylase family protein [bacterium]|nr:divergent polysaccharide deacetylase family protein [candidate division CSSED10-310 bacterium]